MNFCVIEIENLSYAYPDGTLALSGVAFHANSGESLALVGGNGAGKSTLLMHLNGTFFPKTGTVAICGTNVLQNNLNLVRRKVGMVFQNSDDQLFMPTVFDDVAFGPINLGFSAEEVKNRTLGAIEQVRISHLTNKQVFRLSEGQKKLAAIASVLSMEPEIIVLDEPTSNLDPKSRRNLINLLKKMPQTKIIATHDLEMVIELCERTIIMNDGKISADGLTASLFCDSDLLETNHLEKPISLVQKSTL
ncbi:MAG: ABC transporter ATP-binding protein [Candidatus Riflebacteria bacterium]|nr:ABC transporter ATP-binding protein [Candidatus Riflebacteria bacterium]